MERILICIRTLVSNVVLPYTALTIERRYTMDSPSPATKTDKKVPNITVFSIVNGSVISLRVPAGSRKEIQARAMRKLNSVLR